MSKSLTRNHLVFVNENILVITIRIKKEHNLKKNINIKNMNFVFHLRIEKHQQTVVRRVQAGIGVSICIKPILVGLSIGPRLRV